MPMHSDASVYYETDDIEIEDMFQSQLGGNRKTQIKCGIAAQTEECLNEEGICFR